MEKELKKIKNFLASQKRYSDLVSNLEKSSPPLASFVFEAIFAYVCESSHLSLQYEINVSQDNNTTVDFVHEKECAHKLCFELVSPDLSQPLTEAMEPRDLSQLNTNLRESLIKPLETNDLHIEGIKYYGVILESNSPNNHFKPESQTIRLQEKLLEKVEKFPDPADDIFSTIVVDCRSFHFGRFDGDDGRMVMYGKTKNPFFQERWGNGPILGLLNPELNKRNAQVFREKITSLIFVPECSYDLLERSFLMLNHHRSERHLQNFWKILRTYKIFHSLKYVQPA